MLHTTIINGNGFESIDNNNFQPFEFPRLKKMSKMRMNNDRDFLLYYCQIARENSLRVSLNFRMQIRGWEKWQDQVSKISKSTLSIQLLKRLEDYGVNF
jgi:hypothetical protein